MSQKSAKIVLACVLAHCLGTAFAQQVPAPTGSATVDEKKTDTVVLEEYKVTDRQDSDYKAATAITGTKTDTPLIDVPQSIQVITRNLIDDIGALDITDLYMFMPGVTEFSYGGTSSRGFRQEQTRYNGIAGSPFNEFGISSLTNVEQVEVLNGPVGLLYGSNEPGGMINIVTAKAKPTFGGSLAAHVGSYNSFGAELQATGPLNKKKNLLFLVNVGDNSHETMRDNYKQHAINGTADLTYVFSSASRLTLEFQRIVDNQDGARVRGIPFLPGQGFVAPRNFSANEPTDFQNLRVNVYNLTFDHAFSSNFRFNTYARYFRNYADQSYHEGNLLTSYNATTGAHSNLLQREYRRQLRVNTERSAAINTIWDTDFLRAKHKVLTGVEYYKVNRVFTTKTIAQASVPTIDILHPVYGNSAGSLYNTSLAGIAPNDTDKERAGAYLQDQIAMGEHWNALVGTRYERFKDLRRSPTFDEFQDSVFTYRGGIVYKLKPNLAIYYSYAMGLQPQTLGSEDQHGPFPPQETHSHEVGTKFDFFKNRLGVTTSVYDITKTNVLEKDTTPGVPSNWLAPIGEVNSQGFDAVVNGRVTDNWNLSFNYGYNDAKITKSVVATTKAGTRFPNAPRHKAGLWSRYNIPSWKLGLGVGSSYVSERPPFTPLISPQDAPGPEYIIYNAALYFRYGKTQFTLKCDNVFDKYYSRSILGGEGQFPGAARQITLNALVKY